MVATEQRKWIRVSFRVACVVAAMGLLLLAGCGERSDHPKAGGEAAAAEVDEFGLPEIQVLERQENGFHGVPYRPSNSPVGSDEDLYTNVYPVPPNLTVPRDTRDSDDPPERLPKETAKEVLEGYGVVFGPGASVITGGPTSQIIVRQTASQMKLVDEIVRAFTKRDAISLSFRVEIYEVPALHALKIQQSAAESADNTGEWEAVLRLVGSGEGRFVISLTLPGRSGQRAKCVDAEERIFVSDFDWENREAKDSITPVFGMREVGTIFEVDPVLSDDRRTVDLNLSFEHHSAPPTMAMTTVTLPGGSKPVEVATPVFHAKKIVTQLSMKLGETCLLGLWRPTGKPEFESRDVMHIAFLMADLNTLFPPVVEPAASTIPATESK